MATPRYLLSRDPTEAERLANQSKLITHFSGLISAEVPAASDPTREFHVLDAACGSCVWLEDMAAKYPNAKLYGCDISSEMFPFSVEAGEEEAEGEIEKDGQRKKLHLRLQDLTSPEGFPDHWKNKFDLVNIRYVLAWIDVDKWPQVLKNIQSVLQPNGWVQFVDLEISEKTMPSNQVLARGLRMLCRMMFEVRGSSGAQITKLPNLLSDLGYDSVRSRQPLVACGPLQENLQARELAKWHFAALVSITYKKLYAKGEDDTWISGIDGIRERFPLDDTEWERYAAEAKELLESVGMHYNCWIVYAQKKK